MIVLNFPDLESALKEILFRLLDKEFSIVAHKLAKDEIVELHVEEKDEWIMVNKGSFCVLTGGTGEDLGDVTPDSLKLGILMAKSVPGLGSMAFDLRGSDTVVIYLPAGIKHGLAAMSTLEYFVLKV